MPKICYIERRFSTDKLDIIVKANEIIEEYEALGFTLTLRQLYYQFVARDLIPNTFQSYKRLGDIINEGRLAGLIDWTAIEDRTRNVQIPLAFEDVAHRLESAAHNFALDKWRGQEFRPEVWIEKDALVGVIEGICDEMNVAYFSCRGYTSQSEMWGAAMRYKKQHRATGQMPVLIHLGDHDPSGIDMSRDIAARIALFMGIDKFPVQRIALNMDQVEHYGPPPNPAKITDSRCAGYIRNYGEESWELDALEPQPT
jgi:hypothetical protein